MEWGKKKTEKNQNMAYGAYEPERVGCDLLNPGCGRISPSVSSPLQPQTPRSALSTVMHMEPRGPVQSRPFGDPSVLCTLFFLRDSKKKERKKEMSRFLLAAALSGANVRRLKTRLSSSPHDLCSH